MDFNTKADFQQIMYRFLNPLKTKFSKGNARIILEGAGATYNEEVIQFETFSRPLWALVPFWVGGGEDREFEKLYVNGFINGTNTQGDEYWGGFNDKDQRFVEMAAIANGLIFCKEKLWNTLSVEEKENMAKWLYAINDYILPENNWLFFRVLVNIALNQNHMKFNEKQLKSDLEVLDTYYLGDGWYKDGISEHRDYYVSFAMHYYGLIYSVAMKDEDPIRANLYKNRAEIFAKDFIYFFDNNGAAIPYGRSLTYRFSQCAFFSACVFADIKIDLGVVKGIISRHFKYWFGQEMFDNDGILSIGYSYQNQIMSERYNSKGSPYWAMKSFIILALPDNHEFWKTEIKELPKLEEIKHLKYANMLIQRLENGEDAIAYLPAELELYGHGHIIEKYSKFAYSTKFGFSVMRSAFCLEEAATDSMLAFVIDDTVFVRKISKEYKVYEDRIISTWTPFIGINVTTTIILTDNGHIREHKIESEYECYAIDFGFSVPKYEDNFNKSITDRIVSVSSREIKCEVTSLCNKGEGVLIDAFPNTNILFKNTVIPGIKYLICKGETNIKTQISTEYLNLK